MLNYHHYLLFHKTNRVPGLNLQVVFVPDYNVSVAEMLIPGSELSQHIRYR